MSNILLNYLYFTGNWLLVKDEPLVCGNDSTAR